MSSFVISFVDLIQRDCRASLRKPFITLSGRLTYDGLSRLQKTKLTFFVIVQVSDFLITKKLLFRLDPLVKEGQFKQPGIFTLKMLTAVISFRVGGHFHPIQLFAEKS